MERLAARACEPSGVFGVFDTFQQFLVIPNGEDYGNRFALAGDDFGFWDRCLDVMKVSENRIS